MDRLIGAFGRPTRHSRSFAYPEAFLGDRFRRYSVWSRIQFAMKKPPVPFGSKGLQEQDSTSARPVTGDAGRERIGSRVRAGGYVSRSSLIRSTSFSLYTR